MTICDYCGQIGGTHKLDCDRPRPALPDDRATARRRFTSTTLADFDGHMISRDTATRLRIGWEAQHDLAHELAERQPCLTFEQYRTLISAAVSGLPVLLVWETRLGGPYSSWQSIETTTAVVMVDYVAPPAEDEKLRRAAPGMVRLRYWGFAHDIYMPDIKGVEATGATRTYRDAD